LSLQSLNSFFLKAQVFSFDEVLLMCSFTYDAFGFVSKKT